MMAAGTVAVGIMEVAMVSAGKAVDGMEQTGMAVAESVMDGGEFGFGDHVAVGGAGRHHRIDVGLFVNRDLDHARSGGGERG